MSKVQDKYRGCLLGLAAGDAMGLTVDNKSWEQIQESYGPNGLLGYDLQEDFAEITGIEYVKINKNTTTSTFKQELRNNEVYYMLNKALR